MARTTIISRKLNGEWCSYIYECPAAMGVGKTQDESMCSAIACQTSLVDWYFNNDSPTKEELEEWHKLLDNIE